jgi:hypothetical protein
MPVHDPVTSLILHPELWCEVCAGRGYTLDPPPRDNDRPYHNCTNCNGRGVPPIPWSELGLVDQTAR